MAPAKTVGVTKKQGTLGKFFGAKSAPKAPVTEDELEGSPANNGKRENSDESLAEDEPVAKKAKIENHFGSSSPELTTTDVKALRTSIGASKENDDKKLAKSAKHASVQTHGPKEPVLYQDLVRTFVKIEATTKRLEITSYLTIFLTELIRKSPEELLQTIYLSITRIAPDYEGIELGIGESLLIKAIAESTGRSAALIKSEYQETGDLGLVAAKSKGTQPTMFKPKPLTISSVFQGLKDIATITGGSSQAKKVGIIKRLLSSCQGDEAKYIVRSLEGKLRIGLAEKTVLTALSASILNARAHPKLPSTQEIVEGDAILKQVFSELPNYDLVVPKLLENGLAGLEEVCKLTPGVPLKPMLAKPTKSISEVLDRFEGEKFTCEYKYDGERGQIHLLPLPPDANATVKMGKTKIYSRNSEDMSSKYPDIVTFIPHFLKDSTKSFVLDGEVVAWSIEEKKILPFQILATRKRKDVKEEDIKIKICYFAFDILYLNGASLLHRSLKERRELLRTAFREVEGEFVFAKAMDGETTEEIQTFLDQSITDSCEGLMVKLLDGPESAYEPSKRSRNWLKIKKDYLSGIGDSLDLVVIGAYIGKGKRLGSYGAFLLGCLAKDGEDDIQSICKIGTGFSDEDLASLYAKLSPTVIPSPKSYVHHTSGAQPDVWFNPTVLFEVLTADLTLSPLYKAGVGLIDPGKGISLRFPRFVRIRDDKGIEDGTGAEQVAEMYRAQAVQSSGKKEAGEDDFW